MNFIFFEFEEEASLHEYERIQICGQNIILNYYYSMNYFQIENHSIGWVVLKEAKSVGTKLSAEST